MLDYKEITKKEFLKHDLKNAFQKSSYVDGLVVLDCYHFDDCYLVVEYNLDDDSVIYLKYLV